eukprot:GHVL01006283.1.p1 GENE.GHVL01006283.1~~GHVL01006283.1.p1  ORF type:complete len:204 (+),score=69.23 GHVL01006283.1:106-717(+)
MRWESFGLLGSAMSSMFLGHCVFLCSISFVTMLGSAILSLLMIPKSIKKNNKNIDEDDIDEYINEPDDEESLLMTNVRSQPQYYKQLSSFYGQPPGGRGPNIPPPRGYIIGGRPPPQGGPRPPPLGGPRPPPLRGFRPPYMGGPPLGPRPPPMGPPSMAGPRPMGGGQQFRPQTFSVKPPPPKEKPPPLQMMYKLYYIVLYNI